MRGEGLDCIKMIRYLLPWKLFKGMLPYIGAKFRTVNVTIYIKAKFRTVNTILYN